QVFCSICLRVSPGTRGSGEYLVDIRKFVRSEEYLGILLPAGEVAVFRPGEEIERGAFFEGLGLATKKEPIGTTDSFAWSGAIGAFGEAFGAFHDEGVVQDEKLLDRCGGRGPPFGMDVCIGIIELHEGVIELEPADASVNRAAM